MKVPYMKMPVNVELLRKTLEWALSEWQKSENGEESRWNQSTWLTVPIGELSNDGYSADVIRNHCRTSYCIAGYIALNSDSVISGPGVWNKVYPTEVDGGDLTGPTTIANFAAYKLGLATSFYPHQWVGDLAPRPISYWRLNSLIRSILFYSTNSISDLYYIAKAITGGEIDIPPGLPKVSNLTIEQIGNAYLSYLAVLNGPMK